MARKKQKLTAQYTVVNGCNAADGTRYEIGDAYCPENHAESTTQAFIEMGCIELNTGEADTDADN